MEAVTTIGLDIAKSVFQVHGIDAEGKVVIRRQLKRRYVLSKLVKITKHCHLAEVPSPQCFCQGVFTQPRPTPVGGTSGGHHRRCSLQQAPEGYPERRDQGDQWESHNQH
jgi:hypothetical protein